MGIAFSTSKTAVLALLFGLAFQLWRRRRVLRLSLRILPVGVGALVAGVALLFTVSSDFRARTVELATVPLAQVSSAEGLSGKIKAVFIYSLQGRQNIYFNSIRMLREHPFRGFGVGTTASVLLAHGLEPVVVHPHNLILAQLESGGLIGLVFFTLLLFAPWIGTRPIRWVSARYGAGEVLLVTFVLGQVTEYFAGHILWFSAIWMVALAWVMATGRSGRGLRP
jgi:O-antigen ligase